MSREHSEIVGNARDTIYPKALIMCYCNPIMKENPALEEIGVVREISGDQVTVVLKRTDRCHSCTLCKSGPEGMFLTVHDPIGVSVGDRVVIGRSSEALVRATLIVFVVPLITFFGGAFVAHQLSQGGSELVLACGAGVGLIVGALGVWFYERTMKEGARQQFQPYIERVCERGSSTQDR